MLDNLFKLDGSPAKVGANVVMPSVLPDAVVSDIIFLPDGWAPSTNRIKTVTFRRVSFPKELSQTTFDNCLFEDCLFIGTHFSDVEFHGCNFIDCNFWKARFTRVYLDPDSVKLAQRYRDSAANVGLSMYQALLANFAEERQDAFYMAADIHFRRWKRYQLRHDVGRNRITANQGRWRWFKSIVYEGLAGFGYHPLRYFMWTVLLFFLVSCFNYVLIAGQIDVANAAKPHASFVNVVFYTFSVLTVLGFSTVTPHSDCAKMLAVFEALASVGWLGMFTSVLVKRFLR